jgi:transcriptional regulator with XRE-family HTH domain
MAASRNEVLVRFGRRLRQMREDRGRTQEEVGERAGFTGKYVSEIERGLRDPPLTTLIRIAEDGLGGRLEQLLSSSNPVRPGAPEPDDAKDGHSEHVASAGTLKSLFVEAAALPTPVRGTVERIVRDLVTLARGSEPSRRGPRRRG